MAEEKCKEDARKKKLAEQKRKEEAARQAKLAAERRAKAAAEAVSNRLEATYLQQLGSLVENSWIQPSAGVTIEQYVVVRITIERSGRISDAKIVKLKANSIMKSSVERMLKNLKRFKPFPAKITEKRLIQDFILKLR